MAKYLWRVVATWPNGTESRWHYQTRAAADHRAAVLAQGKPAQLNDEAAKAVRESDAEWPTREPVSVIVTKSLPVKWPHPAGEPAVLDLEI